MLIRISLIVAILAGLGVAGIAFFPLQQQIKDTITARDKFDADWHTEKTAHQKSQALADRTQKTLDETKTELASTQQERDAAKSAEAEAVKKSEDLQANLKKTEQDLDSSRDKLAAWESLGMNITAARDTLNSLKRVTAEKDALEEEKAIIYAQANKLKSELEALVGPTTDPELPEGLAGKVLAVDPKFDFVILDIGTKAGLVPRGKLLVSRNGKLVAKLVVTQNIDQNQCVANVMPGPWKQSDVMEGDLVFNSN